MKLKIFCRCSLFPSCSGYGLISTPIYLSSPWLTFTIYSENFSSCAAGILYYLENVNTYSYAIVLELLHEHKLPLVTSQLSHLL